MIRLPTLDDTLRSLCKRADISGISGVPSVSWSTVGDWLGGADRWDDSASQVKPKRAMPSAESYSTSGDRWPGGVERERNALATVQKRLAEPNLTPAEAGSALSRYDNTPGLLIDGGGRPDAAGDRQQFDRLSGRRDETDAANVYQGLQNKLPAASASSPLPETGVADSASQVAEKAPSSQQNLPATTKQLPPGVSPVQNSPASVIKPLPGESFEQNLDSPQMKATGVADSALTMPNGLSPAASQAAFAPSNFTMSQVGQLTTPPAPAGLPPGASIADAAGGSVLGSQGVPPTATAAKQPGDLTSAPAVPAAKTPPPSPHAGYEPGMLTARPEDRANGIASRTVGGDVGFQSGAGIYGTGGGKATLASPHGSGGVVQKPAGTFGDPALVAQTNALREQQKDPGHWARVAPEALAARARVPQSYGSYATQTGATPGASMAQVGSLTKPPATPAVPAAPVIPPAAAAQADSAWQNMKTVPHTYQPGGLGPKPSIGSTSPMGKGSIKPTGFNM